jgi:Domain of unknown function (DUF4167)
MRHAPPHRARPRPAQPRPGSGAPPMRHAARPRHNGSGNARAAYERYLALAREATVNGDPIEAENYYQHAEHYFRVMRAQD